MWWYQLDWSLMLFLKWIIYNHYRSTCIENNEVNLRVDWWCSRDTLEDINTHTYTHTHTHIHTHIHTHTLTHTHTYIQKKTTKQTNKNATTEKETKNKAKNNQEASRKRIHPHVFDVWYENLTFLTRWKSFWFFKIKCCNIQNILLGSRLMIYIKSIPNL